MDDEAAVRAETEGWVLGVVIPLVAGPLVIDVDNVLGLARVVLAGTLVVEVPGEANDDVD